MARTPEGKVKDSVKKVLDSYGAYYFFPVQTGYGATTLDILSCYKGAFLAIETKAPGKKPTVRQEDIISKIRSAGGTALVIDGDMEELIDFMDMVDAQTRS